MKETGHTEAELRCSDRCGLHVLAARTCGFSMTSAAAHAAPSECPTSMRGTAAKLCALTEPSASISKALDCPVPYSTPVQLSFLLAPCTCLHLCQLHTWVIVNSDYPLLTWNTEHSHHLEGFSI